MEEWTDSDKRSFGARLKQARNAKGMTLLQVAAMFDASKQSVGHWETGRNTPSAEQLARLAEEFGRSAEWLLFGRELAPADPLPAKARRIADLYVQWTTKDPDRAQVMYATLVALAGRAGDEPAATEGPPQGAPNQPQQKAR